MAGRRERGRGERGAGRSGRADALPRRGDDRDDAPPRVLRAKPTVWEWVTAGLGAAIVVAAIGFMIWRGVTMTEHAVPRVSVRVDTIVAQADAAFLVEFEAANDGDATAAGLLVEGELQSDTGSVETSQATVDYLPAHSKRRGGLFFTKDPRAYRLALRASGYARP